MTRSLLALPRWLHPAAWWIWALGLAAAASRTTNPLLLVLIIAVAAVVVSARKPDAPWGRSFMFFLRLGVAVIVIRVAVQLFLGAAFGTTILLPLPGLTLPSWLSGARLGGDITFESLLLAFYDGLRLATILMCVGAANSLASPSRLLKSVPAALYEFGVSVVVAMTFTPQLVTDVDRVRTARRLRGRPTSGVRAIAGSAMPVFEGALEKSVTLAAAMDSRGYGRRGAVSAARRRTNSVLLLIGLVAACIGAYALIAAGSPLALGLPMLVVGVSVCIVSITMSARAAVRTRYRPDPWALPETLVAGAGVIVAFSFVAGAWLSIAGLDTPSNPPTWPVLPLLPLIGLVIATTPAITAPVLPRSSPVQMKKIEVTA
ncbi:MAG: energy-coupling factor transporter transmembrane protein EcfT [Candidatus Nanopelagicales bacterium]|nr:energy-coupling factor transporter transmembrane protein EcfT [Candidatus Nanopelagicales bacterium]